MIDMTDHDKRARELLKASLRSKGWAGELAADALDENPSLGDEAVAAISAALREVPEARPLEEWHEDRGAVMWWTWRDGEWLGEAVWAGTPLDSDWPGYHTHWTPHPSFPAAMLAAAQEKDK